MAPLTPIEHHRLLHAVTEYDRKQSTKRFYNRYALAQYCAAIQNVENAINCGTSRREAIIEHFNGRLLDACLKALNLDSATNDEHKFGNIGTKR